jgi:hypothetical protein
MLACALCSPASITKGKVEGIGLGGLAGCGDQAIRVEGHWVLVYLGIVHEMPIYICGLWVSETLNIPVLEQAGILIYQIFGMMMEPLAMK